MKGIRFWLPVGLWMMLIFFLSSRSSVKVSDEPTLNFLFFKTLHVLEYSFLYLLNYRAIRNTFPKERYLWFIAAFVFTIAYALTDEIHQLFVPTREGRMRDVIIDGIGASLTWYLIAKLLPKAPKKLQRLARNWGVSSHI